MRTTAGTCPARKLETQCNDSVKSPEGRLTCLKLMSSCRWLIRTTTKK